MEQGRVSQPGKPASSLETPYLSAKEHLPQLLSGAGLSLLQASPRARFSTQRSAEKTVNKALKREPLFDRTQRYQLTRQAREAAATPDHAASTLTAEGEKREKIKKKHVHGDGSVYGVAQWPRGQLSCRIFFITSRKCLSVFTATNCELIL